MKNKIISIGLILLLAGCGVEYTQSYLDVQDSLVKIRQSISQSSNNFTYTNKDLDLKFIDSQVKQIRLAQSGLSDAEQNFGKDAFMSADLFYLSESFERNYSEDNLTQMQAIRAEVEELLDDRGGAGDLLAELDDFILAEESYKQYLAGELSEQKFTENIQEAESDKLFDLFYQFIDTDILFGSGGIDFQQ